MTGLLVADIHHLRMIFSFIGTPMPEDYSCIKSKAARDYIRSVPFEKGMNSRKLYPDCESAEQDLLQRCLAFHPGRRMTAEQALQHPYLKSYRECGTGIVSTAIPNEAFHFEREKYSDGERVRRVVFEELKSLQIGGGTAKRLRL